MLVVLGYPDMAAAADAVPSLLDLDPIAVEGLDARIIDAVRGHRGADSRVPELPPGTGWLMVELGGDTRAELLDRAARLVAAAAALGHRTVTESAEAVALWRIREDGAGLSARSPRGRPAHSGWEDAAVPPQRLGGYLRAFEGLLAAYDLTGVPYGHFGDGCVHIRIDLPLEADGGRTVFRSFLTDAARLVAGHGGSMSGEHGDGRARGELLPLMYSPAALESLRPGQGPLRPGRRAEPRHRRPPRPGGRGPASGPASLGVPHRRGGAPVHRCGEVPSRLTTGPVA